MKVKRCPVCGGGELQYVHYAPQAKDEPTLWEDMCDVGFSPMILLNRIECKKCGASVPSLVMRVDDAVSYWNDINENTGHRYVLQRIGFESVSDVEGDGEQ